MSTQLYKITRRGVMHSRLEWPNGEVVKGPTHRMNANNQYVPISNPEKGGNYVRRFYGTKKSATGDPVSQFIRLTPEGYRKMRREWGLEPAIYGVDTEGDTEGLVLPSLAAKDGQKGAGPASDTQGEDDGSEALGEIPPANVKKALPVDIPENWRTMNQSALSKIVSELYDQPYKSLPKDQAVSLIEAYLEDAARNGGETDD